MNAIKFSHKYDKLRTNEYIRGARLLEAIDVKLEDLHESFISFDTAYRKGTRHYELPKHGRYILLIFTKGDYSLFTTLRGYTSQKLEYYQGKRGEIFEVRIKEAAGE